MLLERLPPQLRSLSSARKIRCLKSRIAAWKWDSLHLLCLLALALFFGPRVLADDDASGKSSSSRETLIRITTNKEGVATQLFVENVQAAEVTVTFEMDLTNLGSDVTFPYTTTLAEKSRVKMFTLWPIDRTRGWSWTYTYYSTFGSTKVRHDDTCIYSLPYMPGKSYRVSQGFNGEYSHFGADQFAIDWRMPSGTPVYAARGGTVVGVKNDSSVGGDDAKYDWDANYVLIRHSDGTLGQYVHLLKDGHQAHDWPGSATGRFHRAFREYRPLHWTPFALLSLQGTRWQAPRNHTCAVSHGGRHGGDADGRQVLQGVGSSQFASHAGRHAPSPSSCDRRT